ncbi:MAG: bifunctional oligoribonuclease/PAP phosphatase NrnA [Planctomycetes bacterium]|nr:bifunctional oligoribonuclease/PAP phosphatase NrnA [Planctomycetota bacterium]
MSEHATDFLAVLTRAGSVVLTGHESPDGDCLGSQIGLLCLLRDLGVTARVVLPDPPIATLRFLLDGVEGVEVFDADEGLGPCDLLVLLDCCQLGRLGPLAREVAARRPRIAVIDHHLGADRADGEVCFVDVAAAAAGELVLRLYDVAGRRPSAQAARALLASLGADTGWFRYSNTSPVVFERARRLVEVDGVDASAVYDALHRRQAPGSVSFLARAIGRSRIVANGRIGVLVLDQELMDEAGRLGIDLDLVMEPLRAVEGIEVVAVVKPLADRRVKLSLRSQRDVDVQRIAQALGGGGHRKAAGATVEGDAETVATRVVEAVLAALPPEARGAVGTNSSGPPVVGDS